MASHIFAMQANVLFHVAVLEYKLFRLLIVNLINPCREVTARGNERASRLFKSRRLQLEPKYFHDNQTVS